MLKGKRLPWLVIGLVIGLSVGGTVAWAAIPASTTGTVTACYPTSGTSKGALRAIDYQAGARCNTGEAMLTWPSRGFRWRGPWLGTIAYTVNDVVRYNGSAYIAKLANTNISPTNTTNWALMVSKGDVGAPGSPGGQGLQGPPGTNGISGYEQVNSGYINVPGSQGLTSYQVNCTSGKSVLGGGYQKSSASLDIFETYPDGDHFVVVAQNTAASAVSLLIIALCASPS